MRTIRHARTVAGLAGCASLMLAATMTASAQAAPTVVSPVARAVLPANDGWAAFGGGTTGGSAADAAHIFTVHNRAELVAALNNGDSTPKIIQVSGTIDANVDDNNNALTCDDYQTDGYTLDAYLATYDPAVWGRTTRPFGPLEDARAASEQNQAARVELNVGANTTIVGLGTDARLLGGNLEIKGVDNVIVRNMDFENAFDCFPQWDPTDTSVGNWNSQFDNMTIDRSTHVWVDHNTFTDGSQPDSSLPVYFGRIFEEHDGETDIIHGTDFVTVSWNQYLNHDKTNLLGNSDSGAATDAGHLRITMHHNMWQGALERAPRVRFGQVDVYNNFYNVGADPSYVYSLGVGVSSQMVAEDNAWNLGGNVSPSQIIGYFKGTSLTADNNLVNGQPTDVIAAFNAANPSTPLGTSAGWTPTLRSQVDSPAAVPQLVGLLAGAGKL